MVGVMLSGGLLFQMEGCVVDPDILLRAGLSVATDLSVFLLENLAATL